MLVRKSSYRKLHKMYEKSFLELIDERQLNKSLREQRDYWHAQFHRLASSIESKIGEFMDETDDQFKEHIKGIKND